MYGGIKKKKKKKKHSKTLWTESRRHGVDVCIVEERDNGGEGEHRAALMPPSAHRSDSAMTTMAHVSSSATAHGIISAWQVSQQRASSAKHPRWRKSKAAYHLWKKI